MVDSIEALWRKLAVAKGNLSLMHQCLKALLIPFSLIYALFSTVRNKAYDKKIFKTFKQEGIHVISIGNLSLGGTGKTPLTILIANALEPYGKGAVLTRGYRRKTGIPLLIHRGSYHLHHPRE